MPLLDHFHPPVSERRGWEGFHGLWAAALVETLNSGVLADEFFADMQIHIGGRVEIDVATLRESSPEESGAGGGTATVSVPVRAWTPPAADVLLPTVFPDDIEVQVFATATGATLVGAIELVSPGNKDRPETRRAFAAKCVAYLTRGVGLIVVDVVTNRLANLHNDVMELLGQRGPYLLPASVSTYAAAYRPSRRIAGDQIEVWSRPLALHDSLPTLPLGLRNAGVVPVDLEETYSAARRKSRLG
jgi:hypothetical protein